MKKFFYLLIVFILGVFVAFVSYNSNKYQHIYDLVDTAIKEEKYEEIAKIFGGCCDTKPQVLEKNDKLDLAIYNGTSILDLTYGDKRTYAYEETYYIYFFDMKFDYQTFDGTDNATSIIFTSDNGMTYKYPLVVSESTNSEYLEKEEMTKDNAILKSPRNVVSNVDTWDFMFVNVSKSMVEAISKQLDNGEISGLAIIDNKGNPVVEIDVDFDFSQKFFNDIDELMVEYNKRLTAYEKNENVKEAEKAFNQFYEPWHEEFEANKETTGYSFPYDTDYLVPSKVLWKTIGELGIYAAIMFGFYVLFFHFTQIKNFFENIFSKDKKKRKKGEKRETIITPRWEPTPTVIETQEPVIEEVQEVAEESETSEEKEETIE